MLILLTSFPLNFPFLVKHKKDLRVLLFPHPSILFLKRQTKDLLAILSPLPPTAQERSTCASASLPFPSYLSTPSMAKKKSTTYYLHPPFQSQHSKGKRSVSTSSPSSSAASHFAERCTQKSDITLRGSHARDVHYTAACLVFHH